MKTCLVIGNRGMLGSYLARYIPTTPEGAGFHLAACDLPAVDITDAASVESVFLRERPDVVINCAGYTAVDQAETDREIAFRVNACGPELLARAAAATGALLVHVSTDFIFDGAHPGPYREDDPPNPLCVYAKSKLAGEEAVKRLAPQFLVVRTAWLYGPNGKNFVDTILALGREKGKLKVVDDQAGSPTFTAMLSEYLWKLVARDARGVFNVAGSGACTWFDLASEAVRLAGVSAAVTPCTTAEFPRPAHRPSNSALDTGKVERFLGEDLPNWRSSLRRYLSGQYLK
jgi:dTDP-4-dehydrorhamnose reductase